MSVEHNKATIRRLYQEVVNKGNLDAMEEVFCYDVEMNTSAIPEDPEPEYGIDRLKPALMRLRQAFPGIYADIEDLFGEGDRVVARVRFYGAIGGKSDTSQVRRLLWTSTNIFRMFQGKVAEQLGSQDNVNLLREAGVVPLEITSPISSIGYASTGFSAFAPQNPARTKTARG